jgi:hypothetical protein
MYAGASGDYNPPHSDERYTTEVVAIRRSRPRHVEHGRQWEGPHRLVRCRPPDLPRRPLRQPGVAGRHPHRHGHVEAIQQDGDRHLVDLAVTTVNPTASCVTPPPPHSSTPDVGRGLPRSPGHPHRGGGRAGARPRPGARRGLPQRDLRQRPAHVRGGRDGRCDHARARCRARPRVRRDGARGRGRSHRRRPARPWRWRRSSGAGSAGRRQGWPHLSAGWRCTAATACCRPAARLRWSPCRAGRAAVPAPRCRRGGPGRAGGGRRPRCAPGPPAVGAAALVLGLGPVGLAVLQCTGPRGRVTVSLTCQPPAATRGASGPPIVDPS